MDNLTTLRDERLRLVEVDRLTSDLADGEDPVLNGVVNMLCVHFDVPTALVSIVERDYQVFKAKIGMADDRTPREMSICAHGLCQETVLEICNTLQDPRTVDNPLVQSAPHIRYYAGAPLIVRPGVSLGGLCIIDHATRSALSERDRNLLTNAAKVVVARLQSIHRQTFYDPMTGLPNRQRFETDFKEGAVAAGQVAIFIEPVSAAGMDRLFKALGIEFFTDFMLAIKEVLLTALPPGCRLYRASTLGFMTVIGACDTGFLASWLQALVASLAGPLRSGNVPVTPDVGISVLTLGVDASASSDILRLMASMTDTARKSEQRWLAYDPVVDASLRRNTAILNALEAALVAPDQLSLAYQPRIDLGSNRCVAVEALLRWSHPQLGIISPAEFIPLAETTASIRGITRWVVEQVCRQIAQWQASNVTLQVSLNISALDLGDGQLYEDVTRAMARHQVHPSLVELEFTESALVADFDAVQEQLQRFRALGISIGIDDFGSGYSNWIYLRKIPATSVKLDRSLLAELQPGGNDWHIVRGLVSLLRDLRLTVVAEGVETDLHHHVLRGWGCDQGQGYYYARPLPADELTAWLQQPRQA